MEQFMQTPHSNAEINDPTGTAEADSSVSADDVRVTQDGEERIYNDDTIELVNG
jgi:hypothetical protein